MSNLWDRLTSQWRDALNFVFGIWLVLSPWILGYVAEQAAAWNAYLVGAIIAVAAVVALVKFRKWEEWVTVALAIWLIISPWLLGVSALTTVLWNQVVVGLLVGGLAIWSVMSEHKDEVLAESKS